jgi:fructose-1,6-bisphosphatase/inositol monophosphatase family enzyme
MISAELATLDPAGMRFEARLEQISRLRERANLLVRSLRMFYLGMGCFAAAAMTTVLGSALAYFQFPNAFHITAALAFVVGIGGVASLVNGSALTVRETRLAFALLHEEVDEVLKERR